MIALDPTPYSLDYLALRGAPEAESPPRLAQTAYPLGDAEIEASGFAAPSPDPTPEASQESVVEYLPNAGYEWTTGGRAPAWRRLHGPTG